MPGRRWLQGGSAPCAATLAVCACRDGRNVFDSVALIICRVLAKELVLPVSKWTCKVEVKTHGCWAGSRLIGNHNVCGNDGLDVIHCIESATPCVAIKRTSMNEQMKEGEGGGGRTVCTWCSGPRVFVLECGPCGRSPRLLSLSQRCGRNPGKAATPVCHKRSQAHLRQHMRQLLT